MNNPFEWKFLQEPIYRWFLFVVIMALFMAVWHQTLGYMR